MNLYAKAGRITSSSKIQRSCYHLSLSPEQREAVDIIFQAGKISQNLPIDELLQTCYFSSHLPNGVVVFMQRQEESARDLVAIGVPPVWKVPSVMRSLVSGLGKRGPCDCLHRMKAPILAMGAHRRSNAAWRGVKHYILAHPIGGR